MSGSGYGIYVEADYVDAGYVEVLTPPKVSVPNLRIAFRDEELNVVLRELLRYTECVDERVEALSLRLDDLE